MEVEINLSLKPKEGDTLIFYNLTDLDLTKPIVIILEKNSANVFQGEELTTD